MEVGSSDEVIEEEPQRGVWAVGLLFTTAVPRYVGKDREEASGVLLSVEQVRENLRDEEKLACQDKIVWLTTSQMGWPICVEEDEVVSNAGIEENGLTKRCIAPMISKFVRDRRIDGDERVGRNLWWLTIPRDFSTWMSRPRQVRIFSSMNQSHDMSRSKAMCQ